MRREEWCAVVGVMEHLDDLGFVLFDQLVGARPALDMPWGAVRAASLHFSDSTIGGGT